MQGKVPVGLATYTGYSVTALGLAGAIFAFAAGDRSEQTLGVLVSAGVAALAFAITQIGRYVQAKVLATAGANKEFAHLVRDVATVKALQNASVEDLERFGRQLRDHIHPIPKVMSDDGADHSSVIEAAEAAYSEARPDGGIAGWGANAPSNTLVNSAAAVSGIAPAGTMNTYDPDVADDEGPGDELAVDLISDAEEADRPQPEPKPTHGDVGDGIASPDYAAASVARGESW